MNLKDFTTYLFKLASITVGSALQALSLDWDHLAGKTQQQQIDAVKKAYRKIALRSHPDVGGDAETFRLATNSCNFLLGQLEKGRLTSPETRQSPFGFYPGESGSASRAAQDYVPWWKQEREESGQRVQGPGLWEERAAEVDHEEVIWQILQENTDREKGGGDFRPSDFLHFSNSVRQCKVERPSELVEGIRRRVPREMIDEACLEDLELGIGRWVESGTEYPSVIISTVKNLVIKSLLQMQYQ